MFPFINKSLKNKETIIKSIAKNNNLIFIIKYV